MKRRFVAIVDDATPDEQDKVTEYLRNLSGAGFWHYFSDVWLIADSEGKYTASDLRTSINTLLGRSRIFVVQIDGENTWAAHWTKSVGDWVRKTWSGD